MSTVKLTTTHKWKAGHTNVIPVVGKVTFDETASIEIEEHLVEALKKALPEFDPDAIKPQVKEDDLSRGGRESEDDIQPQVVEAQPLDEEKKAELLVTLSSLKKEELQELAVDFPKEEWEELKKEDLKLYLAEKL